MEIAEAKQVSPIECVAPSHLLTTFVYLQREEIAQIAQAEIAKVQMMNKVTAKLEALAVKERERKKVNANSQQIVHLTHAASMQPHHPSLSQEAAAKQAAWEQEQARIARERHMKEMDEFKASEALAGELR